MTFFSRPKESHQRKSRPVRRRYLVASCGIPALLAKAGRLRNSRTITVLTTWSWTVSRDARIATPWFDSARRLPPALSALLGGSQGTPRPVSRLAPFAFRLSTFAFRWRRQSSPRSALPRQRAPFAADQGVAEVRPRIRTDEILP